jgi:hypothetical protein
MNEPVLDGDVYVFRSLPDRTDERLAKSKVKAIVKRTNDWNDEVVWQIEGVSDRTLLVRAEPVKKGRNYVITTWKTGALLSIAESDVRKITRLTGFTAWKEEMKELGVVVLAGETTRAGFKQTKDAPPPGSPQGQAPQGGGRGTGRTREYRERPTPTRRGTRPSRSRVTRR